jgi:NAD-dependent SIR2 family protein deacetylase
MRSRLRSAQDSLRTLRCVECRRISHESERGWTATDDEDEPAEVVVYCPECNEREFGGD